MSKDTSIQAHLARIVGNTKRKQRHLSINEIANSIKIAGNHFGGLTELADKVLLSTTMLRQFLSVHKLHPLVQSRFEKRELDSVDLCAQLAELSHQDQIFLADEIVARRLETKDIRDFRELRRSDKLASASTLLQKVTESKPKLHYTAEFVIRGGQPLNSVRKRFNDLIGSGHILVFDAHGSVVKLVLDEEGKNILSGYAKREGLTVAHTIQAIASNTALWVGQ